MVRIERTKERELRLSVNGTPTLLPLKGQALVIRPKTDYENYTERCSERDPERT
jgi:hypothetical protein